ncbi:hypothetical protein GCM10022223_14790 [Kineosporia mesophila]|uniref:Uncharacterized protein n=1 Tax=Kineosporia mesophila TaxID=566012 RepID=A0ABP6Z9B8_9ACTN|nr:hypothetical protein [Kineosporia mesophila]MCD5352956.1 hypothetical protein [Kineosporia mesophila]
MAATNQRRIGGAAVSSGLSGVLLVYFSRTGENYFNEGRRVLEVGNTEVRADMITERIECDVYRIEAADPTPKRTNPRCSAIHKSRRTTPGRGSPNRSRTSAGTTQC